MCAIAPAGNGGRGRFTPAALPVRTHRAVYASDYASVSASVAAAAAALCATFLITGAAMPLVEWFALPERFAEMKHRPKEFGPHFAAFLLALCGLDLLNDLAGVVGKPVARRTGRPILVLAIKAVMLAALLALAMGASVADPQSGGPRTGVLAFVTSEYAGQWGELAVAAIGDVLLVAAARGIFLPRGNCRGETCLALVPAKGDCTGETCLVRVRTEGDTSVAPTLCALGDPSS